MKVILFDLDGTLTDSGPGIVASVQYALEKMGKPEPDPENLKCFVGPPLKTQFMSYAGFTEEEAIKAVEFYRERYVQTGMFENELYPGIEELLVYLKDHGCILAVASSKPEEFCKQIIEHFCLTGYFTEIVGSGMDETLTTKPEVIETALERLGMSDKRPDVVMVGDRAYDVMGAHECGIQCVGVSYGYGSMEELIKAGVTYVAESVEELEILAENADQELEVEVDSIDLQTMETEQLKRIEAEGGKDPETDSKNRSEYKKEPMALKVWRIFYPILIHLGISLLVSTAATVVISFVALALLGITEPEALTELINSQLLLLLAGYSLISIPILYIFKRSDDKRRASGLYKYTKVPARNRSTATFLGAALLGISLCQLLNDLITLSHLNDIFPSYSKIEAEMFEGQSLGLIFLAAVILAPIAEELVFRGLVQRRIRDYFGPLAGIVGSSLLFGIYHGNMVQFVYATLLGLFMALCLEKSQTLLSTIIFHVMANLWSCVGMSVMKELSGNSRIGSYLVDLVMALVFIGGLSLVVSWDKKRSAEAEKTVMASESELQDVKRRITAEKAGPVITNFDMTALEKKEEAEAGNAADEEKLPETESEIRTPEEIPASAGLTELKLPAEEGNESEQTADTKTEDPVAEDPVVEDPVTEDTEAETDDMP